MLSESSNKDRQIRFILEQLFRRGFAFYVRRFHRLEELRKNSSPQPWRILRYKRVTDPEGHLYPIPFGAYVRPKQFRAQLTYLKDHCRVIHLSTLYEELESNTQIPENTVVITFDDGWEDCYRLAFPLLRQLELPASVFLSTAVIGTQTLYWPDRMMLAMLCILRGGGHFSEVPIVQKAFPQLYSPEPETPEESIAKMELLVAALKGESEKRSEAFVHFGYFAERRHGIPEERSFLNWREIQEMHKAGIQFGTHGHEHKPFDELSREELEQDIRNSFESLRANGIPPLAGLALPEKIGELEILQTLRQLGIAEAVSANDEFYEPTDSGCRVFSRIPIYEMVARNTDLFACRLWQVRPLGVEF